MVVKKKTELDFLHIVSMRERHGHLKSWFQFRVQSRVKFVGRDDAHANGMRWDRMLCNATKMKSSNTDVKRRRATAKEAWALYARSMTLGWAVKQSDPGRRGSMGKVVQSMVGDKSAPVLVARRISKSALCLSGERHLHKVRSGQEIPSTGSKLSRPHVDKKVICRKRNKCGQSTHPSDSLCSPFAGLEELTKMTHRNTTDIAHHRLETAMQQPAENHQAPRQVGRRDDQQSKQTQPHMSIPSGPDVHEHKRQRRSQKHLRRQRRKEQ